MKFKDILGKVPQDDRLKDSSWAAGRCHKETSKIRSTLCAEGIDSRIIYAENRANPVEVYHDTGQYSNHYAVYLPKYCRVVDFTMRQFDPDSDYPYVGTQKEWKEILKKSWDQKVIHAKTFSNDEEVREWSCSL